MASALLLIGTFKLPLVAITLGTSYLLSSVLITYSYFKKKAHTKTKFIAKIMKNFSLIGLAVVAVVSSAKLIKDHY